MTKNLTKKEISKNLTLETGFPLPLSKKLTESLIITLIDLVKRGNLNLKNVGKFNLIEKKERIGRNPLTKDEYTISKRKVISFTSSKNLNKFLNQ